MDIKSAQYQTDEIKEGNTGIIAVIDGVKYGVPLDPANRHYNEIMRQVEAGELTIKEAD